MLKIEIASPAITTKSGIAAKSGKPYTIREQEAFAYVVDRNGQPQKYPSKIRLNLGDDQQGYAVGFYIVDDRSFFVDRFDNLSLGLVLAPVSVAGAASNPLKSAA
jgi:hypothetical protein